MSREPLTVDCPYCGASAGVPCQPFDHFSRLAVAAFAGPPEPLLEVETPTEVRAVALPPVEDDPTVTLPHIASGPPDPAEFRTPEAPELMVGMIERGGIWYTPDQVRDYAVALMLLAARAESPCDRETEA